MHIFRDVMQLFRPGFVHRDSRVKPGFAGFIAGEQGDEVLLRHFALLNAQLHDQAFLGTHAVHHYAHAVNQVVELFWHQTELLEHFRQFQDLFLSAGVAAAFRFDGVTGDNILRAQLTEFLASQFRIDAVVVIAAVVFVFIFVFFIVGHLFSRQFRTDVRGRWGQIFFGVRINEAGDQIRQTCFFCFHAIVLLQQIGDRFRIFSN